MNDTLRDKLEKLKYNLVLLPRPDIKPLQLLVLREDHTLEIIGEVKSIFRHKKGKKIINISQSEMPDLAFELSKNNEVGAKTNLTFWSKIVGLFRGNVKGSISANYEGADKYTFDFKKIKKEAVYETEIIGFIKNSELNTDYEYLKKKLLASQLYVIVRTIKAKSMLIENSKEKSTDLSAKLEHSTHISSEIGHGHAIKASLGFSTNKEQREQIDGSDGIDRVFGFQAIRLIYENNELIDAGSADQKPMRGTSSYEVLSKELKVFIFEE